jgi:hypothetical protein
LCIASGVVVIACRALTSNVQCDWSIELVEKKLHFMTHLTCEIQSLNTANSEKATSGLHPLRCGIEMKRFLGHLHWLVKRCMIEENMKKNVQTR